MSYTRIGHGLWQWRPFLDSSPTARIVWLALYTTPEAKRWPTGLFYGSVSTLADAAGLPFGDTLAGLNELVTDRKIVEQDTARRIIRLTSFPDSLEKPPNGNCIVRWWCAFQTMPACAIRDRHIATLRKLIGDMTQNHQKSWDTTFGTVQGTVPDTVPDTVPENQGILSFQVPGNGYRNPTDTETETVTVNGNGDGERSPDAPGPNLAHGSVVKRPPRATEVMLGAIARASGGRFAADLVDARLEPALYEVADQCAQQGVAEPDFELLGRFLAEGGLAFRSDLGPAWASKPGNLLDAVSLARRWKNGEVPIEPTKARITKRAEPAAPREFRSGRRSL